MDAVRTLKSLVKKSDPNAQITNFVFDLHTNYTAWILLLSFLIGLKDYFGPSINCGSNSHINDFCYIQNTYTVAQISHEEIYEHVGPDSEETTEKVYHTYYKWVHLVYFCLALLTHFPRLIWKKLEGGHLETISSGLLTAKRIKSEQRQEVVEFLIETLEDLKFYAWKLMGCEILNTILAVGQIAILNGLIGGNFWDYGFDIIFDTFNDASKETSSISILFPKMSKCIYKQFGLTGDIEKYDYLCLLPQNVLNEKIFSFLWIWYIGLIIVSLYNILKRILFFTSKKYRVASLKYESYELKDRLMAIKLLSSGNIMLLKFLAENVHRPVFNAIIDELVDKLDGKGKNQA